MYTLKTPLSAVIGIGPTLARKLADRHLYTVQDFLLYVPLRYEDRSQFVTIDQLPVNQLVTIMATVDKTGNYYKGKRSIQNATISDDTGSLKVMWFNNTFVLDKLKRGEQFLFSGKLNDRGFFIQPVVEDVKTDTIHTGRLVPVYSQVIDIKQGTLRRLLKHILDNMSEYPDSVVATLSATTSATLLPLIPALTQLHFPDESDKVIAARQRLALEELLGLMKKSQALKAAWEKDKTAIAVRITSQIVPDTLPFTLTTAQHRAISDIVSDLQHSIPMNRLLVGDVGSGKTVVAGIAALQMLAQGHHVALVAPTQILADQHFVTLQKLFPTTPVQLVTGQAKLAPQTVSGAPATVWVGTHALLNKLDVLQPGLLIYDEQHRFGVKQRSIETKSATHHPHLLTMSATPIPRSLMLTIFAHLSISVIDELPAGRLPTKTWVTPESKRAGAYDWIREELLKNQSDSAHKAQAIIVCPFIDPSHAGALENVAAVNDEFTKVKKIFSQTPLQVGLLHGRQPKAEQAEVTRQLYCQEIDILVTTPIVEVGVDLPGATILVIEAAERFGLASLHQLRGRVGRAGQQGYCLLFTNTKSADKKARLKTFAQLTNGAQVAELDLENRGAGDLFGTQQHGFEDLRFASWTDASLIAQARTAFEHLVTQAEWEPLTITPSTLTNSGLSAN